MRRCVCEGVCVVFVCACACACACAMQSIFIVGYGMHTCARSKAKGEFSDEPYEECYGNVCACACARVYVCIIISP